MRKRGFSNQSFKKQVDTWRTGLVDRWERLRLLFYSTEKRKEFLSKLFLATGLLLVYLIVSHIPLPFLLESGERRALDSFFNSPQQSTLGLTFGLLDIFSGGSLQTFSLFALGLFAYILAHIIMRFLIMRPLSRFVPALHALSYIRRLIYPITAVLALLEALGICVIYQREGILRHFNLFTPQQAASSWELLLALTLGSVLLVGISDLLTTCFVFGKWHDIDERTAECINTNQEPVFGIWRGSWLIIATGIVSHIPGFVQQGYREAIAHGSNGVVSLIILLAICLLIIVSLSYAYRGKVGFHVENPGISPVRRPHLLLGDHQLPPYLIQLSLMAQTFVQVQILLLVLVLLTQSMVSIAIPLLGEGAKWVADWLVNPAYWWYWAVYLFIIVGYYIYRVYKIGLLDMVDNLWRKGAIIPGLRPGKATQRYLLPKYNSILLPRIVALGVVIALLFVAHIAAYQLLSAVAILVFFVLIIDIVLSLDRLMKVFTLYLKYRGFMV